MARRPGRGGGLRRIVLWTALAGVLACAVVAFVLYREITSDLPPVDQLLRYRPPVATRVFADDGTLIGEFFVERRYLVPLDRVPQHVRLAFLAAEDADFYRHRGVDPIGIGRAMLTNSPDGVLLWDLDPAHHAEAACRLAGRDLTRAEWTTYLGDVDPYEETCVRVLPDQGESVDADG